MTWINYGFLVVHFGPVNFLEDVQIIASENEISGVGYLRSMDVNSAYIVGFYGSYLGRFATIPSSIVVSHFRG